MTNNEEKPPSQRGGAIVIAVFVLLFGSIATLFLFVGSQKIEQERLIASDPVEVTAVVVEVEEHETSGKGGASSSWIPTVEFESDGELVTEKLESVSDKDRYQQGDEISVTFQAGNPSTAVESSRRGEVRNVMILPAVFAAIALAFLAFGSFNWFAFRRRFYRERGMVKS